jgi:hypothetical protein
MSNFLNSTRRKSVTLSSRFDALEPVFFGRRVKRIKSPFNFICTVNELRFAWRYGAFFAPIGLGGISIHQDIFDLKVLMT